MTKYVVTRNSNNSLHYGPATWRAVRDRFGLRGNKNPPATPFVRGNFTLRVVVYEDLTEFEQHDAGAVDGDVWRYSAVLKSLPDLKDFAKDRIRLIHDAVNEAAERNSQQGLQATYTAAVAANWTRRKALLDAVDAASNRAQLNTVWQDRNNRWTTNA